MPSKTEIALHGNAGKDPETHTIPAAQPLFPLGRLSATANALSTLAGLVAQLAPLDGPAGAVAAESLVAHYFARHAVGDWGDLSPGDRTANDEALVKADRLFSSYNLPGGGRVWIITEWDRSATTLLLPEDY